MINFIYFGAESWQNLFMPYVSETDTVKLLKIRTPEKINVIILKFDWYGFSME